MNEIAPFPHTPERWRSSIFPENASLFTSSKGYEVVMASYDAEVARAPVRYQSQMVSTSCGGRREAPPVLGGSGSHSRLSQRSSRRIILMENAA